MKSLLKKWLFLLVPAAVPGYSRHDLVRDIFSGVIVAVIALPLSIALAIASGVKPEQGLYTAIFAGFFMAAFSGSRYQIGGPTGAFIVIVFGIVQKYGYQGLAVAGLMAGVLLIIMGLSGLGRMIKYIPYPVTVGFTAGIGLLILTSQLGDLFGFTGVTMPGDFTGKLKVIWHHLSSINPAALLLGVCSVLVIVFWKRVSRRIPGTLAAIVLGAVAAALLKLPVETVGSRFGGVPSALPVPALPPLDWALVVKLFPSALTIALLAGIESLLSAVVADGMTGRRHDSNRELIAQGVGNLISPLFGGIPATGAIARTAANIKNGAVSPLSGMIHAAVLLLIVLFLGDYAALIPMPVLAGILITVAWNMSEVRLILRMRRSPKSDLAVLAVTFLLTVFADLTVAIQVGVVLAALLFMKRMSDVSEAAFVTDALGVYDESEAAYSGLELPAGVEVFEISGPFFFGVAEKFSHELSGLRSRPAWLILRMRHVPAMDATGLRALEELHRQIERQGIRLVISGIKPQPLKVLQRSPLYARIGAGYITGDFGSALEIVRQEHPGQDGSPEPG